MQLLALGINHKTAPLAIREQVIFTPETTPLALRDLLKHQAVNEAVILSTCNRTELYTHTANHQSLKEWLIAHHRLQPQIIEPCFYYHYDQKAVQHIMRVASGLDSAMVGEPQVLGQMKQAVALAQQAGALGTPLGRLFRKVFTVSKQVRSQTEIGVGSLSLAHVAVNLAQRIFADLATCKALLVGAGEHMELVAAYLANQRIKRVMVANRSLDKAQQLADRYHGQAISLGDVPVYLREADIVITSTASPLPLLGKGAVESALKQRKHRPMLMVDLAVPRDVEPQVAELADVYLYNLDDLQAIIAQNQQTRSMATTQAEALIALQAERFIQELRALDSVATINAFRQSLESLRDQEVQIALQQLQQGQPPQEIISRLGHRLLNKITHAPSVRIREATARGEVDALLWLRRLFDIDVVNHRENAESDDKQES
ncbi:MAG: glutamyl-tRNA reductase [Gammaproteobacteria bacterium]